MWLQWFARNDNYSFSNRILLLTKKNTLDKVNISRLSRNSHGWNVFNQICLSRNDLGRISYDHYYFTTSTTSSWREYARLLDLLETTAKSQHKSLKKDTIRPRG